MNAPGTFNPYPILTACFRYHIQPSNPGYTDWITQNRETVAGMKRLEEENNRLFIDAYGSSRRTHPRCPN